MTLRYLNEISDRISVAIPKDSEGFIGRECPVKQCESYFKIKPGTGLTGSDLDCHCPYCGHTGAPDTFYTKEQIKYAESMVHRKVIGALNKSFKSMEFNHRPRGAFGIGVSMKFTPASLPPVRYYRDPTLETLVICDGCTLEYSIYGLFGYCPDCRVHNSLQILERNLELVRKQLALTETLQDKELARHLLEDALENCVSSFDGFGRETCAVRSASSTNPSRCAKVTFQNLDKANEALLDLFALDLRLGASNEDWTQARTCFFKRHVISHRAGVVDQKYLNETEDRKAILGRRVAVSPAEVEGTIAVLLRLARYLLTHLPVPDPK